MANIYLDVSIDFDLIEVKKKVRLNTLMQVKMKKFGEYWWVLIKTNSANDLAPVYIGVSCDADRTDSYDLAKTLNTIINCMKIRLPKITIIELNLDKDKWDLQEHFDKVLKKL